MVAFSAAPKAVCSWRSGMWNFYFITKLFYDVITSVFTKIMLWEILFILISMHIYTSISFPENFAQKMDGEWNHRHQLVR